MISDIISIGEKLIDRFVPDPEQKAKAKAEMRSADLKELELQMSAIVMEAKSNDKWTSRARPAFMYVFYIILLMAIPVAGVGVFSPSSAAAFTAGLVGFWAAIPDALYTLFGTGYLGYVGARSYDKRNLIKGQ